MVISRKSIFDNPQLNKYRELEDATKSKYGANNKMNLSNLSGVTQKGQTKKQIEKTKM